MKSESTVCGPPQYPFIFRPSFQSRDEDISIAATNTTNDNIHNQRIENSLNRIGDGAHNCRGDGTHNYHNMSFRGHPRDYRFTSNRVYDESPENTQDSFLLYSQKGTLNTALYTFY